MSVPDVSETALVASLSSILRRVGDVWIVGTLSTASRARLEGSIGGRLVLAQVQPETPPTYDAVVVFELGRCEDVQRAIKPGGMLIAAIANPRHAQPLLDLIRGQVPIGGEPVLEGACRRLEAEGWQILETAPVMVPLALLPFDPAEVPKTVLTSLYDWHPDIETARFLVSARLSSSGRSKPWVAPARPVEPSRPLEGPWKTEAEYREDIARQARHLADREAALEGELRDTRQRLERALSELSDLESTRVELESQRADLDIAHGQLLEASAERDIIKASLAWRSIVKAQQVTGRVLPRGTFRGRLWLKVRALLRTILR